MRLTLLGVGAMNSPRFAPAGLLLEHGRDRVALDGGPGAVPGGRLDAWLVTDEHSELRTQLRHLAGRHGTEPAMTAYESERGDLRIEPCPVAHTRHPTCGYRILAGDAVAVWAPEFWEFPAWAAGADLMFADAAGWDRPIRFRGGVGGHASVRETAEAAVHHGVRHLVFAHIGRPSIRAMDAGLRPGVGEWGTEGRTYMLRQPPR
ncbi:MBL fold metallo-hydrolase [Streptomyces sp. 7N604]|uniref:MBL fold metallo-hydrolase n=1 Tax=Streptomyces sp. 7N604 TaxID=3457415 RepID=UPI003FD2FBAD